MNSSRIFTLGGGDIAIWSSRGNIDAGKGAKSAISAPPPVLLVDAQGNVSISVSSAVAGSGIRTIITDPEVQPGDVDLIAPAGFVNAGDAGIGSSGNLNIAAQKVVGLDNIQVGGIVERRAAGGRRSGRESLRRDQRVERDEQRRGGFHRRRRPHDRGGAESRAVRVVVARRVRARRRRRRVQAGRRRVPATAEAQLIARMTIVSDGCVSESSRTRHAQFLTFAHSQGEEAIVRGALLHGLLAATAFSLTLAYRMSVDRPLGRCGAERARRRGAADTVASIDDRRGSATVPPAAIAPTATFVERPSIPVPAMPLPLPTPTEDSSTVSDPGVLELRRNDELVRNLARAAQDEPEADNRIAAVKALQSLALNRGAPDPELLEMIRVATTDADASVASTARNAYASVQTLTENR